MLQCLASERPLNPQLSITIRLTVSHTLTQSYANRYDSATE